MKKNVYETEKNIEKILRGEATGFLTLNVIKEIQSKLKKRDYNIFLPYPESEKVILTGGDLPKILLYRIDCFEKEKLQHSSILGSLFGLNITSEMFGDIVLYEGNFYIYFLESIVNLILEQFTMVGNLPIKVIQVDSNFLDNYNRQYEIYEFIVSSERIDTIISRIIGVNREKVQDKIKNKLVLVNGEILTKTSYVLHENDTFSIRGFGKYKYNGIIKNTKKDNYIIKISKYI